MAALSYGPSRDRCRVDRCQMQISINFHCMSHCREVLRILHKHLNHFNQLLNLDVQGEQGWTYGLARLCAKCALKNALQASLQRWPQIKMRDEDVCQLRSARTRVRIPRSIGEKRPRWQQRPRRHLARALSPRSCATRSPTGGIRRRRSGCVLMHLITSTSNAHA